MNTDPLAFLRHDFPKLFHKGLEALKAKVESGDEQAKARYDDTYAARGATRFVLEGAGEVYLGIEGGVLRALDDPGDLPVRMAIAAPADAARAALEELESVGALDADAPLTRMPLLASAKTEAIIESHQLPFFLTLKDLPTDPEQVTLRIGLGASEPPTEPSFQATVSYDDLEDVRNGDMTPQQLLGRLKLEGDASKAMALAMTLAQQRRA